MTALIQNSGPKPKCFFTNTTLPRFVNHEQPPTKKKPFSIILKHPYGHVVDIVLPKSAAARLQQTLQADTSFSSAHYRRVYKKLKEILSGDLLEKYIKTGAVLMISEGRPGIDNTFTINGGILRLEVDRPTYERLGIAGVPLVATNNRQTNIPGSGGRGGGRKHVAARYAVTCDLRLDSMSPGRKAFERLIWACDNVLNQAMTWLVVVGDGCGSSDDEGPLAEGQPPPRPLQPAVTNLDGARVPSFESADDEDNNRAAQSEAASEILEWLSLAALGSPRILEADRIDPVLSRYAVPTTYSPQMEADDDDMDLDHSTHGTSVQDLVRLRWRGLIPAQYSLRLFLALLKAAGASNGANNSSQQTQNWASITGATFTGDTWTILISKDHCLVWEYRD